MFFCPNCDNSFDITKMIPKKTDDEHSDKEPMRGGKRDLKELDKIIDDAIKGYKIEEKDVSDYTMRDVENSPIFKKLNSKQREIVFNIISDLMPTEKKELKDTGVKVLPVHFLCKNCGYNEPVEEGTMIINRAETSEQSYISDIDPEKILKLKYLPYTRNYTCPNEKCITHKNKEKKNAVFMRLGTSLRIRYVCEPCKTSWIY